MLCAHASVYTDWSDLEDTRCGPTCSSLSRARAARFELGVAFDRLGGTSLCCGHVGQGGSCNSMCTSVKRSKTSGHVKWCVFRVRFDTTFADSGHDGHVSGPSRGQSSHRDSVSDPAEGVHRTAHRDPAHAAWRRRAARGHARAASTGTIHGPQELLERTRSTLRLHKIASR